MGYHAQGFLYLRTGTKVWALAAILPISAKHGIHLQVIKMARGQSSFSEIDDNNDVAAAAAAAAALPNFTERNERLPAGTGKMAALNGELAAEPKIYLAAIDAQVFEMPKPDPEAIRQVEALATGLKNALSGNLTTQQATAATKEYMKRNVDKMFEKAADAYPELPFQGMVGALNNALRGSGYSAGIVETVPLEGDLVIRKGNQIIYRGP